MERQPVAVRRKAWIVVAMLFLVQLANYVDKTVLALAAPAFMAELDLSPETYGLIASSFFSLYAVAGLAVGFLLAPRMRPRHILAILLAVWSLAQLPVVFAASLGSLIFSRVLLGAGEGGGAPTALNAAHEWFPAAERNLPTALVVLGTPMGSLLAAPALSYIIVAFGWRAAFLACGLLGAAILLLWLLLAEDGPESSFRTAGEDADTQSGWITQGDVWRDRTVLGSLVLDSMAYWIVGFSVSWLPPFVMMALGYSQLQSGWILAGIYCVQAVVILLFSWISHVLLRRGVSSRTARGALNGWVMLAAGASFVLAALVEAPAIRLVFMAIAIGLPNVTFTLNPPMLSEIAPPGHRNRLVNVMLAVITLAAIVGPMLSGRLIDAGGMQGWMQVLMINAAVCVVGWAAALALLRPEASIRNFAAIADRRRAAALAVPKA